MLSPALFVMYTRTVSADAGNATKASKSHKCLKPIREPIDTLELMADLLICTVRASLGGGPPRGQGGWCQRLDRPSPTARNVRQIASWFDKPSTPILLAINSMR